MVRTTGEVTVRELCRGPLGPEEYFALRPPCPGLPACRRLGLGTAGLGGVWSAVDLEESRQVLEQAWAGGFLLVDSSPDYAAGKSEALLGDALTRWSGPQPVLCTKLEGRRAPGQSWPEALDQQYQQSRARFAGKPIHGLAMHDAEGAAEESFAQACGDWLAELLRRGEIQAAGLGGGGPAIQQAALARGFFRYVITYKRLGAVSLQGLTDLRPAATAAGAAIWAASPVFMGLLGARYEAGQRGEIRHIDRVFIERARRAKELADQAALPLPQLALRFLLSMPQVESVLAGAGRKRTWDDTVAAYEAGPLPADLYQALWQIAQEGQPEPLAGG